MWLVSEQMLWGPWSLQCLVDTFLLVMRFIESRVYFFWNLLGRLSSSSCVSLGESCTHSRPSVPHCKPRGGGVRVPSALCLSRALKFLDSSGAKSRPQWQSTHGKPLRWMSGAIVIVKIEQASELWPELNESHFCRTAMMTGDQSCSRVVDVASPFGPAPLYNR